MLLRFYQFKTIQIFFGIDSVINQSGNKFGRTILFNIVTTIIQIRHIESEQSYLFVLKKQSEGKHHYKCIIACETKLCKIIYKLCSQIVYTKQIDLIYQNF